MDIKTKSVIVKILGALLHTQSAVRLMRVYQKTSLTPDVAAEFDKDIDDALKAAENYLNESIKGLD